MTAGFPCQSFSIAGKRLGFEDTRGTLFFDIARILEWKRPQVFILENVKNLISHDNGNTIRRIVKVLSEMNKNKDIRKFNFKIEQQNNKKITIEDIKENEEQVEDKFYFTKITSKEIEKLNKEISVKNDGIIKLFDIPKYLHNDNERQRRVYSVYGLAPTVLARTDSAKILVEKNGDHLIRKLTPLECFRLQGFDDEFFNNLKEAGLSDSQLYKQAGNAVTTSVITAISNKLKKILGE